MAASRHQGAEGDARAPLLLRSADHAPWGALLLVIAALWLAAAIDGFVNGNPTIMPGLGSSGACVAAVLGAALALVGLDWLVRGRIVAIGRDTVAVVVWSLIGRHAWREPLANYREVRAEREQRAHRYGTLNCYVVRLCHAEPGKSIDLARSKDPAVIARCAREYAAHCGLPLSRPCADPLPAAGQVAARGREVVAAGAAAARLPAR